MSWALFRRHKHNWNLVDKTVFDSPFRTKNLTNVKASELASKLLLRNTIILTFKCDCGDVRVEQRDSC